MRKNPLYQSALWEKFQKSLGQQFKKIDKVLILIKKLPFGISFLEIQRGKFSQKTWQKIKKFAQAQKAIFVRFSANTEKLPSFLQNTRATKAHRFPELSLMLSLKQSETELLAGMSQSGRRHLRQAQKADLIIEASSNAQEFMNILQETTMRQKFSGHGVNFYQKLIDSGAFMLIARQDEQILAAGIFANSGQICTYLYGASSNQQRKLQAPTLLQWTAILQAKKSGMHFYDFFGIAPEDEPKHPWQGVSRFKRKFGGEEISYAPEVEVVLRRGLYFLLVLLKKLKNLVR